MSDLRETVRRVIAEVAEVDLAAVTDTADFYDDLGMDSMTALEIVLTLEERLGVAVPEDHLDAVTTLDGALRVLRPLVEASP